MVERIENLVVIDKEVHGSFLPSSKERLLTDVVLRAGFRIRGGLYGNNITVEGEGAVDGPVMAKRDIVIRPPEIKDKSVVFKTGLSARLAISVKVPSTSTLNPVNTAGNTPLIIRGDVIAPTVLLENAVVVGNVYANDATIKDSVILGCPLVEGQLILRNTTALSFRAGSVQLHRSNSLLVPFGLAQSDIMFCEPRDDEESAAAGQRNRKASLRYMALCRDRGPDEDNEVGPGWPGCGSLAWFTCPKYYCGECSHEDILMDEDDILDITRGGKPMRAITMAPRLLDLTKVEKNLDYVSEFISDLLFLDHYSRTSRKDFLTRIKEKQQTRPEAAPSEFQILADTGPEMTEFQLLTNVANYALRGND